jgi:RimJ/RimL family protein N-acetyltransferase
MVQYNGIILRPLEREDIEPLRILRNRPENRKWFKNCTEIPKEEQIKWYEKYMKKEGDYMFAIVECNTPKEFIGAVALYEVDTITQSGEFGRIIIDKEKASRSGLGYDATVGACQIGFEQLCLRTITLEVFSDNISAIRTYEKAGFVACKKTSTIIYMELSKNNFNTKLEVSDEHGNSII